MIKLLFVAGTLFTFLAYFGQDQIQEKITSEDPYSLKEIIQAVHNATDAGGLVSMPEVTIQLQNPAPTNANRSSLANLIEAVKQCEAEGNLSFENFTTKYSQH